LTFEQIKELIGLLDESSLSTLTLKEGESVLKLSKNTTSVAQTVAAPVAIAAPVTSIPVTSETLTSAAIDVSGDDIITSPMVGTYYQSPSPDASAYIKAGDTVSEGSTLGIIEAMKIMNEIEAEFDCKIVDILVKDGQVIEYDTPLYRIEKA
jgi:acetyl-CoA carboxylase biotin carboxyl carrier protein